MAGLSLGASAPGWDSTLSAMRAMPRDIKAEVSRRGRDLAEPLAAELRSSGHAQGGQAARVADTVKSGMRGGIPNVTARGKPYTAGSEWGGGRRRSTYYGTSPLGRRYLIVQRHTTKQFRPHRGREGYWFTPTFSAGGRGRALVLAAWADLVDRIISEV
jgi:hypothetical protein